MTARKTLAALAVGVVMVLPTASAGLPAVTVPLAVQAEQTDGRTFCVIFPWFFTCNW